MVHITRVSNLSHFVLYDPRCHHKTSLCHIVYNPQYLPFFQTGSNGLMNIAPLHPTAVFNQTNTAHTKIAPDLETLVYPYIVGSKNTSYLRVIIHHHRNTMERVSPGSEYSDLWLQFQSRHLHLNLLKSCFGLCCSTW